MKKILIAIVAILIILAGVFFYLQYASEKSLEEFANSIPANQSASTTFYTLADISAHNSKSDCWMVIDNDVLNVTSFIDKHPGGSVILDGCGKDATSYFNGVGEHMKPIVKMLYQKMVVGKLQS